MNRNIRSWNGHIFNRYYDHIRNEIQLQIQLKKWDLLSIRKGFRLLGSFLAKETSPIFAQRVCRSYQIVHLHSKLWTTTTKSSAVKSNSKRWFLGLVVVSLCDQKIKDKNDKIPSPGAIISKSELIEHFKDLDFIHELTTATVICPECKDRVVVDKKVPNVKYCHCPNSSSNTRKIEDFPWVPYVETADLLIWRQPHEQRPGLFIYKVYGYYDDISPADFLETQLDLAYRKKWDSSALKLDVLESDKKHHEDIVHWEMQWPRMFSNRDYCFARRHLINEKDGTMVIMNKAVVHPKVPVVGGVVRVHEYWSVMHIKGVKGLHKPGVEFGLTYYDNPGVSLPSWLLNWAAMTAIPDFLNKVRNAARARKKLESRRIYLYSHHPIHTREAVPTCGEKYPVTVVAQQQPPPTVKSEILSQFFKENILESSLNEV